MTVFRIIIFTLTWESVCQLHTVHIIFCSREMPFECIYFILSIYLLAQIKIHKINSNCNSSETVLSGQEGSMSTYRCSRWSLHAKSACMYKEILTRNKKPGIMW